MILWSGPSGPRITLQTLEDLLRRFSAFHEHSAHLPGAFLIAVANLCSICRCGPKSPGGLCLRKEHCCVQMFILGCVINDFNYLETSCGFGLALSQLASLASLPWGPCELSVSSFMAFQDPIKHIQVPLTVSQC